MANKKLTIADVAEHLGVSKTTVSRVISGKGRIGEETRQRVLSYINEQEYHPNVIAKGLAQSKTFNIAVLLPMDCNITELPFFQSCMLGISEAASARDYDVLAVYAEDGKTGDLERIISNHKIDGVILSRTLVKDTAAEYIKKRKLPVVAIGSSTDETLVQVDHDHRSACDELTSRLLARGIRRLGLIGGKETHMVTKSRFQGYADAFSKANIPVNPELVCFGAETNESIEAAVEKLLDNKAECIVCMDDMICNHVIRKLKRKKIAVPEQMPVASYYEGVLTTMREEAIPTIAFEAKQLGNVSCNILLDMIEEKAVAEKTLLPYMVKG